MFSGTEVGARRREHSLPPAFVVEDDVMMLRLLSEVAAAAGLDPMAFTRISSARSALRRRTPALLLIDDDLPDGRGGDLVAELRASPRTRDVKVLFCTSAAPGRRQELLRLAPVVQKPFTVTDFERALSDLVGH